MVSSGGDKVKSVGFLEYGDIRMKCGVADEIGIDRKNIFADYPDLVTSCELAEMLGIGRNTALQLLRDQVIPSFKIGNVYKIPKMGVTDFVIKNCNDRKEEKL